MNTVFTQDTLVNGRPTGIRCLEIDGQTYSLSGKLVKVVRLEDEWYQDVHDPESVISTLRTARVGADLFTFWQRLPDTEPRFQFHQEWESVAALPVGDFDSWWNGQITSRTRNLIRKAAKAGLEVREACYDDAFVRGMTEIFNETPIRQGRRFWHYGKDFATVKRQFSRYLFRETLIGAYYRGELIGFVMLGDAGRYGVTGQIISKIQHRDKATNNALIAKAVEICARKGLPYLVYFNWGSGSLMEFKRRCGFRETRIPRYYVALTETGRVAMRLELHRGWKALLPLPVRDRLKSLRGWWLGQSDGRER
jgi:hypothetical protein